ncbi:MAG: DUF4136 domain-containing protein [Luteolibacter sp.]
MNLKHLLKQPVRLLAIAAVGGFLASCSTGVDMPKGTSKGYHSARLIKSDPNGPAITNATEKQVHGMIQKSLSKQFAAKGLSYGGGSSDLVVAYLVIYQEPGMTATYPNYFGYGRNPDEIADLAHTRGSLENKRPDYFRQAGIVIDVIDSHTNKLVYRNFAKGDVIKGASAGTRAARIDAAVGQALAEFFR